MGKTSIPLEPSLGDISKFIPNECLLEILSEHQDFSNWKPSGKFLRDPEDKARTLGPNGLQSFKGGPSQTLFEAAKERGLVAAARERAGLPNLIQQNNSAKKKSSTDRNPPNSYKLEARSQKQQVSRSDTVQQATKLWQQPSTPEAEAAVQKYLNTRALDPLSYKNLWESSIRCVIDGTPSGQGFPALILP